MTEVSSVCEGTSGRRGKGKYSEKCSIFVEDVNLPLMQKRYLVVLVATLFLNISTAFSQVGLRFSYWTVLDGNAFRNYENLSDVVYQPNLTFFYDIPYAD